MFTDTLTSALKSLGVNKLRSFLTMLGVIIGVFAVVTLVSMVKGVENFIVDRFNALGSNLIIVAPGRAKFNQDPAASFSNNKLTEQDAETISKDVSDYIIGVTPSIRTGKTVKYKSRQYLASVAGQNEQVILITSFKMDKGTFFTKSDVEGKERVAVIGYEVRKKLFDTEDPIGKSITINKLSFKVIGYFKEGGQNIDDRIMIPFTTLKENFGIKNMSSILVKAKDPDQVDFVMKKVEISLLKSLKEDEFTVLSQKDILASVQNILKVLSIGLSAVAAISLVVGGIGIMNIMLVSVTERTQEIGLRKALGATSGIIGLQFILESIVVSVSGGLIGLFLGWLLTTAVKKYINAQVPWWAVLISIGFSVGVGVLFGTYPAYKASRKDPIESLRYE